MSPYLPLDVAVVPLQFLIVPSHELMKFIYPATYRELMLKAMCSYHALGTIWAEGDLVGVEHVVKICTRIILFMLKYSHMMSHD